MAFAFLGHSRLYSDMYMANYLSCFKYLVIMALQKFRITTQLLTLPYPVLLFFHGTFLTPMLC